MTVFNNILLIVFICLCSYCLISRDKTLVTAELTSQLKYNVLVIVIFTVAVFARTYLFGSVPGGFNQDGAMAAVDGKALADYKTDRYGMFMPVHLTAWGFGQMSSLLSYFIAFFVKFFGLSPVTARLPQLIMSLFALVALVLFVKDTFGKKLALITAFFAAINPWHIMQSRWALDCNLYPQFFIIGVYFLNSSIKTNKTFRLILSMVMFGLCMYCYGVSIYTMPLFLFASCIYLLYKKKITAPKAITAFLVYFIISAPFVLTMAINYFKLDTIHTPFFTIPYFEHSIRSNDILFFSQNFWAQLRQNINSLLNTTLLQKNDLIWNNIPTFGTMYLFSVPFTVLGLVTVIKEHKQSSSAMLLLFYLLTGVWCGLITNNVNINRINIIYYPIIVLSSVGIYKLIISVKYSKWCVFTAYIIAFAMFISTYFTSYADTIKNAFFKDFGDAVYSVKDSDAKKIYITADSQYKGASNVSEILTLFYHNTDAKYYQSKAFSEKYVFDSMENIRINPDENAVYVVTSEDLSLFDPELFIHNQFGSYYTILPR